MLLHIRGIHKLICNFKKNAGRISVWASGTESWGAGWNIGLDICYFLLQLRFFFKEFCINKNTFGILSVVSIV